MVSRSGSASTRLGKRPRVRDGLSRGVAFMGREPSPLALVWPLASASEAVAEDERFCFQGCGGSGRRGSPRGKGVDAPLLGIVWGEVPHAALLVRRMEAPAHCSECGTLRTDRHQVPRSPCPRCGCKTVRFQVYASDRVAITDTVSAVSRTTNTSPARIGSRAGH